MKKKAFITGVAGQDGSYLAEYLLSQNYIIYGIVRRNSITEHQTNRLSHIINKINLSYGDLMDRSSIDELIKKIQPDEIYNLAAQSHVKVSSEIPYLTSQTNAIGTLNILESIRINSPKSKFYQASSSEMFGRSIDSDGYQRETTKFEPTSPYGCSKVFSYNMTKHYRHAYKIFAVNGILFNHESPRRASNFVTSKIIKTAIRIKNKVENKLILGNLDSSRDWGHSKDYVKAMHLMLQHLVPDDFVVSTGETRTIRQLCEYVFKKLNLDLPKHIEQSEKFMRPEELPFLKGDSSKIRKLLGWKPEYNFEMLIDEMLEFWEKNYNKDNILY
jgi:GDPmannose 4,6-dehydratase